MKIVILANGEFPKRKELLWELQNAPFLIACDGAVRHLHQLEISPDVVVGDLDSIPPALKHQYPTIHIQEQESNDLSKAFFYGLQQGGDEFVILGATGKREDHSIANIFLLQHYYQYCKNIKIKSDFGIFGIYFTPFEIPTSIGQQISLFSLTPTMPLSSRGLKYPLKRLCLSHLFMGSLNEASQNSFALEADAPTGVIVYQKHQDILE
ncbi:thiamine pyrophosphokinase [Helicobacter enhydrae]|uniref:Thiamine diphosphokinase n=1 Tax=Helicobacter enhydrae TaxID=222136 RepID=A0A1B1U619_9HELI|nr:thiamine diphosphokinase [Helicobacter enhydrae]ANV98171.1 thiamine pyrophosphokinase [Helicobacter enhydrae]